LAVSEAAEHLSPAPQFDPDAGRATHIPPLVDSAPSPTVAGSATPPSAHRAEQSEPTMRAGDKFSGIEVDIQPEAPHHPAAFKTASGHHVELEAGSLQKVAGIFEELDAAAPHPAASGPPIGEHDFRGWNPAAARRTLFSPEEPEPAGWSMGGLGPPVAGPPIDIKSCPGRFGPPATPFPGKHKPFKAPRPLTVDSSGSGPAGRSAQLVSSGQRTPTWTQRPGPTSPAGRAAVADAAGSDFAAAAAAAGGSSQSTPTTRVGGAGAAGAAGDGGDNAAGGAEGGVRERRTGPILLGKGSRGAFRRVDWLRGAAGPARTTVQVWAGHLLARARRERAGNMWVCEGSAAGVPPRNDHRCTLQPLAPLDPAPARAKSARQSSAGERGGVGVR
jgi:hypothetical protein